MSEKNTNEFVEELKKCIKGRVLADDASLEHYSTDGSVFTMQPWTVVLPSSREDIKALVKWLAAKKRTLHASRSTFHDRLSITCRGKATDQAGGPVNDGIILRFPGYLDKILEVGDDFIRVEPGVIWTAMQDELVKRGRFVPCYPASAAFSTIGGGVANNCSGEKTVKYGSMRDYVVVVKMVIDDGTEIEFKPRTHDELIHIESRDTREGEIHRRMRDLLIANHNLIENARLDVNKSSTGYWLWNLLGDQEMNLAPLIVGSQGTLGVITEITLKTVPKPPLTGLLLAAFDDLTKAGEAIPKLLELKPSALEMIDRYLIEMVAAEKSEMVKLLMEGRKAAPALVLFVEFDGDDMRGIKEQIAKSKAHIAQFTADCREAYDPAEQEELWKARRAAAIIAEGAKGDKKALPFIEDSAVHPKYLTQYLGTLYEIFKKYGVAFSIWGHAGNGNLHVQPFLNLKDARDREKLFAIADEVYREVIRLRGAISGEHNDGLMRSPYLRAQFGEPLYKVFAEVKSIFDPQNIFNPRKKIGVDLNFIKSIVRPDYKITTS